MDRVRRCREDERTAILAIVNAAAEAYRDVIPADCWHEPYMPADELDAEIAAGVTFWGVERTGALVGVIGSMQALEAIKELVGIGEGLVGRLLLYDARAARFETVAYRWDPDNPLNGRKAAAE